jgi:hypothetical protein
LKFKISILEFGKVKDSYWLAVSYKREHLQINENSGVGIDSCR